MGGLRLILATKASVERQGLRFLLLDVIPDIRYPTSAIRFHVIIDGRFSYILLPSLNKGTHACWRAKGRLTAFATVVGRQPDHDHAALPSTLLFRQQVRRS